MHDPLYPRLQPVARFTDDDAEFRRLVTKGALLELVTAGFYRFWLATRIRRYLWGGTFLDGDPLEYLGTGRELLVWSKAWFETQGLRVLYGDTDSLFVESNDDGETESMVRLRGQELATRLTEELSSYIQSRWRLTSRLELKFEKLYLRLFLPLARHSNRGASKRYVGLLGGASGTHLEFIGMEVVRRDWTELAKQVQRELYQRLFAGEAVSAYLSDVVRRVRAGELDGALVYRKHLRKGEADYTTTTPPHVVAARKSGQRGGSLISYVMTTDGAEPVGRITHAIDREHYIDKQIKPVAEPVLAVMGQDFDQVIGDHQQFDFYSLLDNA